METNSNYTETNENKKNYNLKSDAVEDLVNEETPDYSEEELEKYRSKKGLRIPEPVKIFLIKCWFAGAVCFFFLWGLGTYIGSMLDMLFILGVALGIVTDLLTNNVLRFVEKTPGANDKWMMYPRKKTVYLFLNIVHAMVIVVCVYLLYNVINYTITSITGNTETVPLGVEPILFGVFCTAVDAVFIKIKQTIFSIFRDAKKAAGR